MELEVDIEAILSGRHVGIENKLDFESAITEEEYKRFPVTKWNVCYICCSILFNEEGQVLLVQEAKQSCYGQWYLPAGRMEPKETIIDGTKRELKEEAGLECDLNTLLCVEIINHDWMRFTFTGKITGGKLKTTNEKDKESLQAKFFSLDDLPVDIRPSKLRGTEPGQHVLRCGDILKLIRLGQEHRQKDFNLKPLDCVPVIFPHKFITHRMVIVDRQANREETMHVLASNNGSSDSEPHIPCLFGSLLRVSNIHKKVSAILHAACSSRPDKSSFHVCGILGIEHRGFGEQEDGMCITYLVSLNLSSQATRPAITSDSYFWHPIQKKTLQETLSSACLGQIVPLL